MGNETALFQKNCEYRFYPGTMELSMDSPVKGKIHPAYLDQMFVIGDVAKTDFFILRAVSYYGVATAAMVVEFLSYFKNYYGVSECSELLQPNVELCVEGEIGSEGRYAESVKAIRKRLRSLSNKSFLLCQELSWRDEEYEKSEPVFFATANTVSIVRDFFGKTAAFGSGAVNYECFYGIMPVQRVMEHMHACRVATIGFMGHGDKAVLCRNKEIIFGALKERYVPTVLAEVKSSDREYHVVVEPMHFSVDRRILTESEHLKNLEVMVDTMGRLIAHYRYVKNILKHPEQRGIRFILAVENLEGMRKILQMMQKDVSKFSGKVFFTTDVFLKGKASLKDSVFMAMKVKDDKTGEFRLGLFSPTEKMIADTKNKWIYT